MLRRGTRRVDGHRPRRGRGAVTLAVAVALLAGGAPAAARRPAPAALVASAAGTGDPAAARPPMRIVVLDLTFQGVAPDLAQRYEQLLREELRRAGYDVIDRREARGLLEKLGVSPNCTIGPCLKQVGSVLSAPRAVIGSVVAQGSNYDATVTLLETGRGNAVAQALEHCEVCTADEGLRSFARVVGSLTGSAGTRGRSAAPGRALVWREPPPVVPWYRRPFWRIATLATGAALIAGGVTLIWVDGSCTEQVNCPRHLSTMSVGVALVSVGALIAGGGVGMLLIRGPDPNPRLSLALGPGGLVVGGRF